MKKTLFLVALFLSAVSTQAQRFFYLESNPVTDRILQQGLINSAQYVTVSPLGSDYIIKTGVGIRTESNSLQLQIILQDSITLKTIFQTNEEYGLGVRNKNSRVYLRTLIQTFIDKNIGQIIVCAKDDHYDAARKYLKARKDKT